MLLLLTLQIKSNNKMLVSESEQGQVPDTTRMVKPSLQMAILHSTEDRKEKRELYH